MKNSVSLDTLCAALCYSMGVDAPEKAAEKNASLCEYVDKAFEGKKADRLFMYNPDAVAQWIYEKYPYLMQEVIDKTDIKIILHDRRTRINSEMGFSIKSQLGGDSTLLNASKATKARNITRCPTNGPAISFTVALIAEPASPTAHKRM